MHSLKVCDIASAGLGAAYAVATYDTDKTTWAFGATTTLSLHIEATFANPTTINGVTFKVQIGRTTANAATATAVDWTDLRLTDANAGTAATEYTIAVSAGNTVGLDLYCPEAHRGRALFRVLAKRSGAGVAVAGDALAAWSTG